jgi:GT2 family glycosyltransferase
MLGISNRLSSGVKCGGGLKVFSSGQSIAKITYFAPEALDPQTEAHVGSWLLPLFQCSHSRLEHKMILSTENKVAVVIASTQRSDILLKALESIMNQNRTPDEIVVSVISEADLPGPSLPSRVRRVFSKPGASVQRNAGIDALVSRPLFVAFLDDDVILHPDYLRNMEQIFKSKPHTMLIMGHLLANGNISLDEAHGLIACPPDCGSNTGQYYPLRQAYGNVYGANMCIRFSLLEKERFDERLPLYSLMEDVDMGTRARRYGEIGYYFGSLAVHLRVSGGRISYRALGFSEVMNPMYLGCKGTIPKRHAILRFVLLVPVMNAILACIPNRRQHERWQRLIGNLRAVSDIVSWRIEPERATELDNYQSSKAN